MTSETDQNRPSLDTSTDTGIGPWIVSLLGVAIADIAFWFVFNYDFFAGNGGDVFNSVTLLKSVELLLLVAFSAVLIYAGYWLATSEYNDEETWWVSLWCLLGLGGIVSVIVLVQAHHLTAGKDIGTAIMMEELLMGAGGGSITGLLIGLSTARAMRSERLVSDQRNAFVFLNRLLRHHVLNGMQIIGGQARILDDRNEVKPAGEHRVHIIRDRSDDIADLTQNARVVAGTISGEAGQGGLNLSSLLESHLSDARSRYDDARFDADVPDDVAIVGTESLGLAIEHVLENAVEHNDAETPRVEVSVETTDDHVIATVADNGPGIPDEEKDVVFEPKNRGDGGFGLYLGKTIVEHCGGEMWVEDNDPRGSVVAFAFERPN